MLILDIGNTFTKWCLVTLNSASAIQRFKTEDLENNFPLLLKHYGDVRTVYVSTVRSIEVVNLLAAKYISKGVKIIQVRPERERGGLRNGYFDHEKLGVDRWLAMVSVWTRFKRACCVVCAGTALTIDLIDGDGQHLGGYILPGLRTTISSLNLSTDLIDCLLIQQNDKLHLGAGHTTTEAVQNGAALSLTGALQKALQLLCMHSACKEPVCVIGGGDAEQLMQILDGCWIKNEFLVVDGLKLYAQNGWQI